MRRLRQLAEAMDRDGLSHGQSSNDVFVVLRLF